MILKKESKIFFLAFLFGFSLKSQVTHILGGGFGYTTVNLGTFNNNNMDNRLYQYYGDFGTDYYFRYKHFAFKAKADFQPFTNFGLIYKFLLAPGFATNPEKRISFHVVFGAIVLNSTKKHYTIIDKDGATFNYRLGYQYSPTLNMGIYYEFPKNKRIHFGFDSYIYYLYIDNGSNYTLSTPLTFDFTFNYTIFKGNDLKHQPNSTD